MECEDAMTRAQRLTIALIVCVPTLVMLVLGALHLRGQVENVLANSQWLVSDAISRQIGREVRIGKTRLTPLGKLVLQDVSIAEGPSFDQGTLATARQVFAGYDYAGIFFEGAGASGVHNVEVIEPRVWLVRRPDGALNISDILKPKPGPAGPPFMGKVKVVRGHVVFRDYYRISPDRAIVTSIRDMDVDVDAAGGNLYSFNVSAHGSAGRFLAVRAVGSYNRLTRDIWVDGSGSGIDAVFLTRLVGWPNNVRITGGRIDCVVDGFYRIGGGFAASRVAGVARVTGLSGQMPGMRIPVERVNGIVALGGDNAVLKLTGTLAGMRADVSGSVSSLSRPNLNITVSAKELRVRDLTRAVKVSIPPGVNVDRIRSVSACVTGPASHPCVQAVMSVPSASVRGYQFSDIELALAYSRGLVAVRSIELNFRGARVQAAGNLQVVDGAEIHMIGRARGVDLARMSLPADYRIRGKGEADLLVTGTLANPRLTATAFARDVWIQGVSLGLAEVQLTATKAGVAISRLRTTGIAGGSVTMSGTYSRKRLNVQVAASGLQLASLGKLAGRAGLSGALYVRGSVSGPINNPGFTGLVEGFGLKYQGRGIEYARAAVTADNDTVNVKSAVIRWFPAEVRLSGRVARLDDDNLSFSLSGQAERLNLDRVFAALGRRVDVSGTVAGDFAASGVYNPNPAQGELAFHGTEASGTIRLQDGTAFTYPVDDAVAQWTYRNDVLHLAETVIASEGARLILGGNVYVDKRELDVDFGLADLDLKRFREIIPRYVAVAGEVNITGVATGPWNDVRIDLDGGVQGLVLNGMSFDKTSLKAVYLHRTAARGRTGPGDVLSVAELALVRGDQQYGFKLSDYSLPAARLGSGVIEITNASIPQLWDAIYSSPIVNTEAGRRMREFAGKIPKPSSGVINLRGNVSGPVAKLNGGLTIKAGNIAIDSQRIDSVELVATAEDGVVALQNLTATSGETVLQASGNPFYRKGDLQLALSVNNLNLGRLKPWLKENTPTGIASVELDATGRIEAPNVTMSIEIVNPGIRGFTFDRLRAGRIDIADGKISFPDPESGIILASADHQIVVHGFVPWDWSTLNVPRNQPLQVAAGLNKEDLSILGSFISEVDQKKTRGPIEVAEFKVGGTLESLTYDGALRITNGTIALKGFTNEFQNVNVDMTFDGNRVLISALSAKSSLGGSVQVEPGGTLGISGKEAGADLVLTADALKIAERGAFGLKEVLALRIDAGLSVTGSLKSPDIIELERQGATKGIVISDALLRFAIPEKVGESKPFKLPINARFEVGIDLGKNVRVQPPSMNLIVTGSGLLSGRANDPTNALNLQMDIAVQSGSVNLAVARLKVLPGSTMKIAYTPPNAPEISLSGFKAITSVNATNEIGQQVRYQIMLTASGDASKPKIALSSNPPGLSNERMLAALGHVEGIFTPSERGLQNELAAALTATATSALFLPIERVFTEQLGFEQFSLEYSPLSPLSIYASTRLIGSLYLSYFQRLQPKISEQTSKQYEIRASWRFRQNYDLSIGTDDQEVVTYELGYTRAFW